MTAEGDSLAAGATSPNDQTPSWPGLTRPPTSFLAGVGQGVGARIKSGHDGSGFDGASASESPEPITATVLEERPGTPPFSTRNRQRLWVPGSALRAAPE